MQKVTVIDITDLDKALQRAAFGDGLTYNERLRSGLTQWMSAEAVDAIVAQNIAEVERLVAAGEFTPIVSARGIVGYLPSSTALERKGLVIEAANSEERPVDVSSAQFKRSR